MAKQKVSRPASKVVAKVVKKKTAAAKKLPVVKKVAKRATGSATKPRSTGSTAKRGVTKVAIKSVAKQPAPRKEVVSPAPEVSLGRPLVTQEEKLYMLFHDDYHSRQVFEFLRVQTVKELEEFTPQQIIHLLSKPIRLTVERIRQRLAKYKRSLRDDEVYALECAKLKEPI